MDSLSEPLTDSVTIGERNPDNEASSETGRPRGETGCEETPKEYADRPEVWRGIMEAKRRRDEKRSAERRKAIDAAAWCKLPVTSFTLGDYRAPSILMDLDDGEFPADRFNNRLPPSLSKEQHAEIADLLERAKQAAKPAGPEATALILAKLSTVVMVPDTDADVMMATYVEDLQNIPADLIESACRTWRRSKKFWPTICELLELCEQEAIARRGRVRRFAAIESVGRNPAPGCIITSGWLADRREDGDVAMSDAMALPKSAQLSLAS